MQSVSTDSRTTAPDSVFFALSGDNFDGHQFIRAAFERGALAAVVEEAGKPLIVGHFADY